MREFKAQSGSSFTDVCLNTYGTLDNYVKMLSENGVEPNQQPTSGQVIEWDDKLVSNQTTQQFLNRNNIIFATLTGYGTPEQENPTMSTYKDALSANYTATDPAGESLITILALQGNEIIQVTQEIQLLKPSAYTFNSVTGVIELLGAPLAQDATLFVLYKKTVSV